MSGAEKFVIMLIAAGVRAGIEAAAESRMQVELDKRESERLSELARFAGRRTDELRERLAVVEQSIREDFSGLPLPAQTQLEAELATISAQLREPGVDPALIDRRIVALERQRGQLRQQQAEQAGLEFRERIAERQARLAGLQQRLTALGERTALQREYESLEAAAQSLNGIGNRLLTADETTRDFELRIAARSLDRLEHFLQEHEDARRERDNSLEQALAGYEARVAGLRADATVMRWLPGSVDELAARAALLRVEASEGRTLDMPAELAALVASEQELVARAAAAQIRADQRDYIAASIRATLQEMGFLVSASRMEHGGHPASALSFSAVNDAGRAITVSVPIEGEIFYDIDGFPLTTESKLGGGTSATCDQAQQVLEEMHTRLEAGFQVQAGQLGWEGQDPDRILRSADELPRGGAGGERRQ